MDTIMLSLDTSSKKTGYALFENGVLSDYGLIECTEKEMEIRFKKMALALWEKISHYSPAIVVIEETVVIRNPQTQRFLTRLQGIIYAWCMLHNAEFITLRPTEWRSAVGINSYHKKREVLKQEAIVLVSKNHPEVSDVNDDTAESILIGDALLNMRK